MTKKRKDYISWDELFMGIAILCSKRSKDPNTQVGACIVDKITKIIIGTGYNGLPRGVSDNDINWQSKSDKLYDTKYPYIVHAEQNAILNSSRADLSNCSIYVTTFPCATCAILIIQKGIKEIYFLDNKHKDSEGFIASKRILDLAGVKYMQIKNIMSISINK